MAAVPQPKTTQNLGDSAAMKKMLSIASKLYSDSPQLFDPIKGQSFLLNTASTLDSSVHLPPLPGYQGLSLLQNIPSKPTEKTPLAIQKELEALQKEYENELVTRDALNAEKQDNLKSYIRKEQVYRERIEEYSRCIK